MTEHNSGDEKIRQKRDMVALSDAASAKIEKWIEQINAKKTVNLSRKSFLSWYIENAPECLSNAEVNLAIETFYDTEAHLRQLLRDLKKAKADGQADSSFDVFLRAKKTELKKVQEEGESDT